LKFIGKLLFRSIHTSWWRQSITVLDIGIYIHLLRLLSRSIQYQLRHRCLRFGNFTKYALAIIFAKFGGRWWVWCYLEMVTYGGGLKCSWLQMLYILLVAVLILLTDRFQQRSVLFYSIDSLLLWSLRMRNLGWHLTVL